MNSTTNPWMVMWTQPRQAIRAVIQHDPRYGVYPLAAIYALQQLLFFANYWSLGISLPFYGILIGSLLLAPLLGFCWLYFIGWIYHFTGKWLKGRAPHIHLRAALAWSKIPTSISLIMWLLLSLVHPHYVFIMDAGGPSSVFINFIALILWVWSLALLVQSLKEIQFFSTSRALLNIFLAWVISLFLVFILILFFRYVYGLIV